MSFVRRSHRIAKERDKQPNFEHEGRENIDSKLDDTNSTNLSLDQNCRLNLRVQVGLKRRESNTKII